MAGPGAGPYYDAQGNLITNPVDASSSQNPVLGPDGRPLQATAGATAPGVSALVAAGGGTTAGGGAGGGNLGAPGLAAIVAALDGLLANPVTPKNAANRAAEIENVLQQLARIQQNITLESAQINTAQAEVMQEAHRLENE